jgi:hypothetical protein
MSSGAKTAGTLDDASLASYLRAMRLGDGPVTVTPLAGGQSNPTFRIQVGNESYVLRKKPAGALLDHPWRPRSPVAHSAASACPPCMARPAGRAMQNLVTASSAALVLRRRCEQNRGLTVRYARFLSVADTHQLAVRKCLGSKTNTNVCVCRNGAMNQIRRRQNSWAYACLHALV